MLLLQLCHFCFSLLQLVVKLRVLLLVRVQLVFCLLQPQFNLPELGLALLAGRHKIVVLAVELIVADDEIVELVQMVLKVDAFALR